MFIKSYLVFVLTIIISVQTERIITTLKYSRRYRVKPTVVNGIAAESGQAPYVVSIKEPQLVSGKLEKYWSNICGGAIFGDNRVLTAAHCFEDDDFTYAKRPQTLSVVAGALKNYLPQMNVHLFNTSGQWRRISKVVIHEHFHFPSNDLAIVYLNEPWEFSSTVQPAPLATSRSDHYRECWTAGYGRVGHEASDRASEDLLIARVSTLPSWQCNSFWETNMDNFICSDSTTSDVSQGDSGTPMVCLVTFKDADDPSVEGIVCGKNFDKTTLYTRVSAFQDWISKNAACKIQIDCILLTITMFLTN